SSNKRWGCALLTRTTATDFVRCPPRARVSRDRHCEEPGGRRSNPGAARSAPGLLRRFAPRNDESKLFDHMQQPLDVLRPREAMVAVLDQGEHHVVLGKSRGQLDRMSPRYVGILHALKDAHRAAGFDQAPEQKMITSLFDQPL